VVNEDWDSVARVTAERMAELGLSQAEICKTAGISRMTLLEIQQNRIHRRRSPRTLEALSVALGLHPQHLSTVLDGRDPAAACEPRSDDILDRLAKVERDMRTIGQYMNKIDSDLDSICRRLHVLIADLNRNRK
jgi:transcriptional regulator with XRE-family HTH domain